ncbi:MAG: penicillin acylase family protein [Saprospiraceae bacterium]
MKVLKIIFASILLLISIVFLGFESLKAYSAPDYKGTEYLSGITSTVKIIYDEYGIPHIYASNEEDAYYALGYVYARDRLFQTQIFKIISSGRLSEFLGTKLLDTDMFLRTLGLRNSARKNADKFFSNQDKKYHKSFNAYLDGFNAYMMNGKLPVEFYILGLKREKLEPVDSYSIINLLAYGFTLSAIQESVSSYIAYKYGDNYLEDFYFGEKPNNFNSSIEVDTVQIKELIGYNNKILSVIDKYNIKPWNASNSWVIGKKKSKTGQVILANDTHFAYSEPGAWYEAEISYPGYNFYGLYLPGVPFPVIGHNQNFGWGLTIFPFDNSNYYLEKIDTITNKVMYKNNWVDIASRKEIIKIKGEKDYELEVKETPHNSLISSYDAILKKNIPQNISLWWTLNNIELLLWNASMICQELIISMNSSEQYHLSMYLD